MTLARLITGDGRALTDWYLARPFQGVVAAFDMHLSDADVMRIGLVVGIVIALLKSASAQGMVIGTLASMLIAFGTGLVARQMLVVGGVL
jgi:hypothetical protein